MKTVEEIANVIVVRNHLSVLLNGTRNVVRKQDVQPLSAMINKLDGEILQASLELFSTQAQVAEDEDVQKKIAEAKAKLHAVAKSSNDPVRTPVVTKAKKPAVKRVAKDEASESDE